MNKSSLNRWRQCPAKAKYKTYEEEYSPYCRPQARSILKREQVKELIRTTRLEF